MAPTSTSLKPFQLLEINIISAQDLEPVVSKKMRTYASAWIHQNRKLSTCVDAEGKTNPTWNDKFVFRVDDDFLRQDTSAIMIDIFAVHWFKDVLVGTVRVLVGNLIPPPARSHQRHLGMRFVALQVRRPSGRPQGILNIGVALLDSSMRSMPLYTQMSAVGYRDLMEDPPTLQQIQSDENRKKDPNDNEVNTGPDIKPILRRTRSERSERIIADNHSPNSSIVAFPTKARDAVKESSILSITDGFDSIKVMKKKGKASSVISGAELREKPKHNGGNKKSKAGGSVLSDSILSKQSSSFHKIDLKETKNNEKIKNHDDDHELIKKPTNNEKSPTNPKEKSTAPTRKRNTTTGYEYNAPNPQSKHMIITIPQKKGNNNSVWSDSEVGPSPSEVAAAMAERRLYPLDHHRDDQSSVLDGWSVDESVEGLRSKLARWRTELPPLYDRGGGFSSSSFRSSSRHVRRHTTDGGGDGNGMFSCFGNIFGYECQCVCGKPMGGRRSLSARFHSPSTLTPGRSFL